MQPVYNHEIDQIHDSVSQIVFVATNYLRELSSPGDPRTFTIMVEPLVGRITNVRNFQDHYAIVISGSADVPVDVVRHAYLHFLLDPLPLRYPHVIAVKRPVYDAATRAPRLTPDLRDDSPSYFAECLVRAVELKLKRMSPGEREAVIDGDDADGYVLVRPLFKALATFEGAEPSMRLLFSGHGPHHRCGRRGQTSASGEFRAGEQRTKGRRHFHRIRGAAAETSSDDDTERFGRDCGT